MSELFFVIKSLLIAVIITLMLQVKVGKQSAEEYATQWLQTSPIAMYLQEVSSGGVLFIKNSYISTKSFFEEKLHVNKTVEKASRLNFEFKRSTSEQP